MEDQQVKFSQKNKTSTATPSKQPDDDYDKDSGYTFAFPTASSLKMPNNSILKFRKKQGIISDISKEKNLEKGA